MEGQGVRSRSNWRNACVVRAQTVAANLRMIEFAVEGGLPAFRQGARTRVRAGEPDFTAICSHVCVYVGQERMRVLVAGGEDVPGVRFMWSLVEGARVRLTVPVAIEAAPLWIAGRPRLALAGFRLDFGKGVGAKGSRGCAGQAANGNLASPRPGLQGSDRKPEPWQMASRRQDCPAQRGTLT
jgi:hypothetical protein